MTESVTNPNIRQLCLKLKPILGSKMDQIYSAFLAEDTEGRNQIEHYVELLAAKYLPQKLEQSDTVLLPPSKEQASGEYEIGTVTYASKDLYQFGLREDEWIQHCAILGRSGAGKTNTGFVLLKEIKKRNKPFLIFDWKRNYRDIVGWEGCSDIEIYTIGRNISPMQFNPLIPPPGCAPRSWLKRLNEVVAHAYCLGNGVLFLLQQAVDSVYEEAGVYDGTVKQWPTYKDVLMKARSMDLRGRESGWLSSTLRALSSLCFGDMDKLLNTNNNKSLDHILDKNVILELDALTQSDKVFFIQALLLWIHHKRMAEEKREDFKHVIVIEESHHVLSDERRSLVGGQSVMEIIFREIREFGESLIFLDQHPSKISLYALGNTYTTICMNLKHRSDINAMAQCMLLDKDRDILGSLEVGQAVVKLQGRIQRPFQISIPQFKIEKGKITDDLVREHMKKIALNDPDEDFIIDATQSPEDLEIEKRKAEQINFLKDIQDHPESGIAVRYKRLKLSVRQGQKMKTKLIEQGLIEEHHKTTNKGRLSIIQLTPKGKAALDSE
ncbi:ATP-binding protein [Planctomycetota bacterium]